MERQRISRLLCTTILVVCFLACAVLNLLAMSVRAAEHVPLALHPENGHYFLFRGKPTVLIASGEHYGAVLNLDFDYRKYLDTLAADGLNNMRIFSGAYVEPQGAFNIARNTLARRLRVASSARGRGAMNRATPAVARSLT